MNAIAIPFPRFIPEQRPGLSQFLLDLLFGALYAVTHTAAVRNTLADAVVDLIDGGAGAGFLEFQTSGDVEVATITFLDPAFGAASAGIATANTPMTDDSSAAGGTTDRFDVEDSNNLDVFYGSVGVSASGEDIELSSVAIGVSDTVSLTSLTYAAPA